MRDIYFNIAYGDISLNSNGDLSFISDDAVVLQKILQVLKSSYLDYEHFPYYGADLESSKGKAITRKLAETIRDNTLLNINREYVVPTLSKENLPFVIEGNTIHFRLLVTGLPSIKFNFSQDKGFKIE